MAFRLSRSLLFVGEAPEINHKKEPFWPDGSHNVTISVWKVGDIRESLIYRRSFKIELQNDSQFYLSDFPIVDCGLYLVREFRIPTSERGVMIALQPSAEQQKELFFRVTGYEESDPRSVSDIAKESVKIREGLINYPLFTNEAHLSKEFIWVTCILFCVGGKVYSRQDLLGCSILPYGNGLSNEPLRESVNIIFSKYLGFELYYNEKTDNHYRFQTPTFGVIFHNVIAKDEEDARAFSIRRTEEMLRSISFEIEASPTIFGSFVIFEKEVFGGFHYHHYGGNLLAPLNSTNIAEKIEIDLPKFRDPRSSLLMNIYFDALKEKNLGHRVVRLWTLLETVAKDKIPKSADPIKDEKGLEIVRHDGSKVPRKNTSPRVYYYLLTRISSPLIPSNSKFNLWEAVTTAYEMRNKVVHEGSLRLKKIETSGSEDHSKKILMDSNINLILSFLEKAAARTVAIETADTEEW